MCEREKEDRMKAKTAGVISLVAVLLVLVSVFFFAGSPASAASGTAGTELESQPEEDEEEGAPWVVVIVGIMLGVVSFLLAWFLFNPPDIFYVFV